MRILKWIKRIFRLAKKQSVFYDEMEEYMYNISSVIEIEYGVSLKDMLNKDTTILVSRFRHILIKMLYDQCRNYSKVGKMLNRHHATIMHSIKTSGNLMEYDREYIKAFRYIEKKLK